MADLLEFILKLRNDASKGVQQFASDARSSFGSVDRLIGGTQKGLADLGKPVRLNVDTGGIARAGKEVDGLGTKIKGLESHIGRYIGIAAIGAGGLEVIKTGAEQQRDITGLSTFMGGWDPAKQFYDKIQQDARLTPFVTHDLMAASRMLISTGVSADQARSDIHNLANAVAAVGGSNYVLERMAMHLQTIKSNGYAGAMQLREFGTNGINIYKLLTDYTGHLVKKTEGLKVSYEDIMGALAHASEKGGFFYGALEAQSQTILGKWSTFLDDLQNASGKIVMGQSSGITGIIDMLDKYAQNLPETVEKLAPVFKDITSMIAGTISFVARYFEVIKLGGEVYIAWKAYTLVMTGANWLLAESMGGVATSGGAMAAAMTDDNAELVTQSALVNALATEYEMLGGEMRGIAGINMGAMEAQGLAAFSLNESVAAGSAAAAGGGLAGGLSGLISNGMLMVGVAWMAADLISWLSTPVDIEKNHEEALKDLYGDQSEPWNKLDTTTKEFTDSFSKAMKSPVPMFGTAVTKVPDGWPNIKGGKGNKKGKGAKLKPKSGAEEASDRIIGGGQKKIIIQIRSLVEHFTIENNGGSLETNGHKTEEYFREMLLRLLKSIPGN